MALARPDGREDSFVNVQISICYSATYHVPMLHFTASDASELSRKKLSPPLSLGRCDADSMTELLRPLTVHLIALLHLWRHSSALLPPPPLISSVLEMVKLESRFPSLAVSDPLLAHLVLLSFVLAARVRATPSSRPRLGHNHRRATRRVGN